MANKFDKLSQFNGTKDKDKAFLKGLIVMGMITIFIVIGITIYYKSYVIPRAVKEGNSNVVYIPNKNDKNVNVVRAKVNIDAGTVLNTDIVNNFEIVSTPVDFAPLNYISSLDDIKDKSLKYPISEKQFLTTTFLISSNEWYKPDDKLVEHNFQPGSIPEDVKAGSIIDVKLFRQGSVDLVVLAKKTVISRKENVIAFYLNYSEQEYIKESSSEGTQFIVEYANDGQPASQVTYTTKFGITNPVN